MEAAFEIDESSERFIEKLNSHEAVTRGDITTSKYTAKDSG